MTVNFTIQPPSDRKSDLRSAPLTVQTRMSQGIYALAIAVVGLMALGSATRVMNAGLSCPDWPLCYGQVLPQAQMNLQVFLEWFHRLVATSIGLGTIALLSLALWFRSQLPKWLPWSLGGALLLVLWQGVLGALTVTQLLRFDIVTAHLGTGLLFFVTLLTIATCLIPMPQTLNRVALPAHLWKAGAIAATLIYGQSLLGGLVATRWALHQCFGQQQLCNVMNHHLMGVVPATLSVITLVFLAMRAAELPKALRSAIHGVGLILMAQLLLGYATFRLHLQVEPLTVMHQMIGALLLGSIVLFTLLAYRLSDRASRSVMGLTTGLASGEPGQRR
jgi:heme a synthase